MCAVVNHTAGGYAFYKTPQYHRIIRFRPNGVPMDRPGHYVYLRDDEDGDYWSISLQPVGKPLDQAEYICRHGMSYIYENLTSLLQYADDGFYFLLIGYRYRTEMVLKNQNMRRIIK